MLEKKSFISKGMFGERQFRLSLHPQGGFICVCFFCFHFILKYWSNFVHEQLVHFQAKFDESEVLTSLTIMDSSLFGQEDYNCYTKLKEDLQYHSVALHSQGDILFEI